MGPKTLKGPSSFCEWVVGTTIESALRPVPRKSHSRDVVRVEISTDDETEEDSVKVSYPRTGRTKAKKRRAAVKKVRFEEAPPKSAMKKPNTTVVSSDSDDAEASKSTTDVSVESPDVSSDSSKSSKKIQESESDNDSEPHPTCKATSAKHKDEISADSSESDSKPRPKFKPQKVGQKGGKKAAESESEDEASTSAPDSEKEEVEKKTSGKKKFGADKEDKKKSTNEGAPSGGKKQGNKGKAEESAQEEKPAKTNKNKKSENDKLEYEPPLRSKQRDSQKKGNYAEAFPGPHPRRPHYIEPVRAEVVQTERVIETPQDPPPNAYYDAEHNIVRVYHGPVWGGNSNYALYPRRDSLTRPLPIGMPHPTQNPYYWGFSNPPPQPQPGYENIPAAQDMPMNTWNAMGPHSGENLGEQGGFTQNNPPGLPDRVPGMNRGAFHVAETNGGPPSNKDRGVTGANNVGPGSIKSGTNPYYKPRSLFSAWGGSNRTASHGSRQNGAKANGDGAAGTTNWSPQPENTTKYPAGGSGNQEPRWDNQDDQAGDGAGAGRCHNQNNDNNAAGGDSGQQNDASDTWGNSNDNDNSGQDSWAGNNNSNNGEAGGEATHVGWGNDTGGSDKGQAEQADNNVAPSASMPGAWDSQPAPWGDPSAAASTDGQVNCW